jgi:hypothetical protein
MRKADMMKHIDWCRNLFRNASDMCQLDLDKLLWWNPEIQEHFKVVQVREAYDWIVSIMETEHYNFRCCYRQRGPDYWTRLKQFGDEDMYPEWRQLQGTLKAFKRRFFSKDKPVFFRKKEATRLLKHKIGSSDAV